MALQGKRLLFVNEYIKLVCEKRKFNATEAARRAGYSENGVRVRGHELMEDPEVRAEIDRVITEEIMSPKEVLVRFADEARGTVEDFIDLGSNEPYIAELEEEIEQLRALAEEPDLPTQERLEVRKQMQETRKTIDRLQEQPYRLNLLKAKERGQLHLLKALKPTPNGIGFELYDAQAAKAHIGRANQMFTDNVDHTSKGQPLNVLGIDVILPKPHGD